MKRKLLMALLAGTLAIAAPVSCFAEETTEAAEADVEVLRHRRCLPFSVNAAAVHQCLGLSVAE